MILKALVNCEAILVPSTPQITVENQRPTSRLSQHQGGTPCGIWLELGPASRTRNAPRDQTFCARGTATVENMHPDGKLAAYVDGYPPGNHIIWIRGNILEDATALSIGLERGTRIAAVWKREGDPAENIVRYFRILEEEEDRHGNPSAIPPQSQYDSAYETDS